MKFKMNEQGFESSFEFGELKVSGQSQYGYRPFQLMISSIVGCSGGVLRNILEKMRLSYDDITIEAEATRNEEKANRIEKIHLTYTIIGEDIPQKKAEKAIQLTRKNCAMLQSVVDSIAVTEEVHLKSPRD
ncbi:OsmC family protein [Oceanobacillus alkalisoli]|uniref:OsmC family protein n=1 Tax=Oceanobacillus alkalisoli TaxID=2925113 RepID=UPI001F11A841|nr:OsmC family protein [Oceanobacillus alkalisoli]MCF3943682.1 OsmC family protein [Oceanobacillus alkalisoli]